MLHKVGRILSLQFQLPSGLGRSRNVKEMNSDRRNGRVRDYLRLIEVPGFTEVKR